MDMKNKQPANAVPKILAFAQGEPAQTILLFIPEFKAEWNTSIKQIQDAIFIPSKKQWTVPYSSSTIRELEQLFAKDILFAFMVGKHLGNHKTDL